MQKLSEEVIPIKESQNGDLQSFLKVNYIGNNTYILVLEQNEMIISFIGVTICAHIRNCMIAKPIFHLLF